MLLAHDIPDKDLQWFLDKGILVKKCKLLIDINFAPNNRRPPVLLDKFYLFTEEFKKWRNIVYLDTDIIVRKSLEKISQIDGFAAARAESLANEFNFSKSPEIKKILSGEYNFNKLAFNSGVMAFNTEIIKAETFERLMGLFYKYHTVVENWEEAVLNLFFYNKWVELPFIYNLSPYHTIPKLMESEEICKLPAIVFHFLDENKPWRSGGIFYQEWKQNFIEADDIKLKKIIAVKNITDEESQRFIVEIEEKINYYHPKKNADKIKLLFEFILKNKSPGRWVKVFGEFLKNKFPGLYYRLGHEIGKYSTNVKIIKEKPGKISTNLGFSLLVTLADKNYIDQAKQLFSSVYFNAGWQGDYMLLAHDIPDKDLQWFLDKGILVKKCKPLFNKFYLFAPEFKKWKSIVCLDADIIVRKSLENITGISGFVATRAESLAEEFNFTEEPGLEAVLAESYDLYKSKEAFSASVMAFNTEIINGDSFKKLLKLFYRYRKVQRYKEEPILNLYLYKKWGEIPRIYNLNPYYVIPKSLESNRTKKIKAAALCFSTEYKPWDIGNIFYKEWKNNLDKADYIDLKNRIKVEPFTEKEIKKYSKDLRIKLVIYNPVRNLDKSIGQYGLYLKSKYPRLYSLIKKIKK